MCATGGNAQNDQHGSARQSLPLFLRGKVAEATARRAAKKTSVQ
ncbi:Uncharacterised protein [uncultured Comamonas sp.]|nr:Uncharacterised protein [uncultured Comamonas sp.]